MKNFLIRLSFVCATAIATGLCHAEEKVASQTFARLDTQVTIQMDYLLYVPPDYDTKPVWPVMLFLHGSGERGNDLALVRKHGLPKLIEEGTAFPFIVVSPQCPSGKQWDPFTLLALLDDVRSRLKIDEDRIYITGISMGGFGTWMLAAYAPEQIAAIAPICGGGDTEWAENFATMPVWAFHGAKDNSVPPSRSQAMIDALKKKGGDPRLTIYPDAGHDSWTATYDNPELYAWLLSQSRPKRQ